MRVKVDELKAVLLAAGKKDIRFYLNGVHINGTRMVGCDGHRFHAVKVNGWEGEPVIIPRQAIEAALKVVPKGTATIEITSDRVGLIPYTPEQGTYPDVERFFPRPDREVKPTSYASINADYLKDAQQAVCLVKGKGHKAVPLELDTKDLWSYCDGHVLVGIMALRVNDDVLVVPF